MEIYFDTEFVDNGRTIDLISLAMVREDGANLYLFNNDPSVIKKAYDNLWIRNNVLPSIPLLSDPGTSFPLPDHSDSRFMSADEIAQRVLNCVRSTFMPSLWTWFGAYDMVILAQLYGGLMKMPSGMPQRVNDVAQEAERLGVKDVPSMPGTVRHDALHDATEIKWRREWLRNWERRNK